jgi:RHS repeat-associated protein
LFGFTGRAESTATGLRNHWNRWTDSHTADWMSEDPAGFAGRDANTRRYCGNEPVTRTDPTGLQRSTTGAMYLANIWERKKLVTALKTIDTQCAKYSYYDVAGVKAFLRDITTLVTSKFVKSIWAPDIIFGSGAWNTKTRTLSYWDLIPKMSPPLIIHELTHALDHKNGWYLGFFNFAAAILSSEQLAYSVQHLFQNVYLLERFEDNVKAGRYVNASQVQQDWQSAWIQLAAFSTTTVYVNGVDKGRITNAMLEDVAKKTGLSFSYAKLAPVYQQLVNKHLPFPVQLREPRGLPKAFK